MKITINENQIGLLYRKSKFIKLLYTGTYRFFANDKVELLSINQPISSQYCSLEKLIQFPEIKKNATIIDVGDEQYALHYMDGKFSQCLPTGLYAFWNMENNHKVQYIDVKEPLVQNDIPRYIFTNIPRSYYKQVNISQYEKGRLFYDQKLVTVLDAGVYYFWNTKTNVDVDIVDMRLKQLDVIGQEVLTKDKVTLRINLVAHYRVTDCVAILTEIDDYLKQLYVMAQLVLREYIGNYKMEELLENKEEIGVYVFEQLKQRAASLYIEITDAGIKDIILPGDMREIMNTVLIAEKRAQANVITRREEVASTRSLLNTAKLLDENKTLYRLKELEYLERICENVGNITLQGNSDILTQLAAFIQKQEVSS